MRSVKQTITIEQDVIVWTDIVEIHFCHAKDPNVPQTIPVHLDLLVEMKNVSILVIVALMLNASLIIMWHLVNVQSDILVTLQLAAKEIQ